MNVRVCAPGTLTTVQDAGRDGWRHVGVARAGALDGDAAALANRLVGNADNAAVLELTVHGPTLQLLQPARIALCGADVTAWFEDASGTRTTLPGGHRIDLPAGVVHVGTLRDGLRAWLALAGGIDVPVVLGSRSTDLRGGFGGFAGRALRRGDVLTLGTHGVVACAAPAVSAWWIGTVDDPFHASLRFVASPHPAAARLDGSHWRVSPRSNRQGLRLEGEALHATAGGDAISAAVAPGTLQLPPDGKPIVLLADAQTVGGYPRLGYVIAADLPRLAQWRPGEALQFRAVDPATAAALSAARRARLARLHYALADRQS